MGKGGCSSAIAVCLYGVLGYIRILVVVFSQLSVQLTTEGGKDCSQKW